MTIKRANLSGFAGPHEMWSKLDCSQLVHFVGKGLSWREIARRLKRSANACKVKYFAEKRRAKREQAALPGSAVMPAPMIWAPDPRSLTALICGDPLPGRSALDQRAPASFAKITLPTMQRETGLEVQTAEGAAA